MEEGWLPHRPTDFQADTIDWNRLKTDALQTSEEQGQIKTCALICNRPLDLKLASGSVQDRDKEEVTSFGFPRLYTRACFASRPQSTEII